MCSSNWEMRDFIGKLTTMIIFKLKNLYECTVFYYIWYAYFQVWYLWRENKSLEVVDSSLGKSYDIREVLRCIHIGLLCVQESADIRPTMSQVVFMLCNETTLPSPSQPAYIFRRLGPKDSSSNSVGAISVNELTMSIIEAR